MGEMQIAISANYEIVYPWVGNAVAALEGKGVAAIGKVTRPNGDSYTVYANSVTGNLYVKSVHGHSGELIEWRRLSNVKFDLI